MNNFHLEQYQRRILTKEAPPAENPSKAHLRLTHVGFGLSTEVLELNLSIDRENTIEEAGDFLWYMMLAADVLSIPALTLPIETKPLKGHILGLKKLTTQAEKFLSVLKKHLCYGVDQEETIYREYYELWHCFLEYIGQCDISLELLVATNEEKLGIRYKEGFTKEEAEKRVDKQPEPQAKSNE